MGALLKQVLATLCGVNQWSYAAFWKIGFHNSKLLIWEECYYKPNPELPSAAIQGCWASDAHSSQLQDPVHMLINKMISNNQVNLVGQGLVGRAAFTGNHVWILSNNYTGDAHPPEVLSEIRHQFSAGMQTVAVIPVSLHGVVQLGSSLSIMENVGFVNNVKSLIMQLGCVPGALLSDSFVAKESTERIGVPISFGAHHSVSSCLCGNKVDNCHRQGISSLSSGIIQPSHSQITHMQDPPQSATSTIHASNVTASLPISYSRHSEPKMAEAMKTFGSSVGELLDGVVAAEVVPSNPDAWMSQHSASLNSLPAVSHQSVIDQFDVNNNVLMSLEQQVLDGVTQQTLGTDDRNELDCYIPSQLKSSGGLVLNSCGGSSVSSKELNNGVNKQLRSGSVPFSCLIPQNSAHFNNSSTQLAGVEIQDVDSLRIEEIPSSSLASQLSGSRMLSGGSYHRLKSSEMKQSSSEPIAKKEKMDDDLFQALNILPTQANEHISLDEHMSGSVVNFSKHGNESQSTKVSDFEDVDSYTRAPPGDDLYDALGADFKSRLLSSKWDDMLVDGECANAHTSKMNSTLMNVQEASSDFFTVSQQKFDSSIFSSTTTDNLLDAVVSRAHSTAKRCLGDDVSCKTTLTKISSSSVASSSSMYGPADIADQVHKGLHDLPKSIENSATIVSSSFRSGCSKDDVGSCSQSTSAYGSQLSSWIGHSMRSDSSISTAYSKKNDEMTKPNRKRLKPGENPRPRPKDRQMIQDRMKELREIVPNGAKLSIDALLERTIKHMLFLQSVTKHADKLKQTGDSKIMNKEGGLLLKDSFEGGATWAFEVGSQSMVCPIIVEDLNPPRQMLVEMLCEERGLFLEIADLIRGLGLTILKGVMEAWNDKIWARFAVEANRDVTRMEVFMSLVRLLEQPAKDPLPSTAALENDNMTVHHAFPQTTSIAVTGRPSSLQ